MKNIFILYIPPSNHEAIIHYEDTIKKKVAPENIFQHVDQNLQYKLVDIFGNNRIAVWGSRSSEANRSKYERIREGDDILIVEGETIKLLGKIAAKTINPSLSREVWKNIREDTAAGWNLIYFIANPLEIDLPFTEFKKLFNYLPNWSLRGFTSISENRLEEFYSKYDDLYSILIKIKQGLPVETKKTENVIEEPAIEGDISDRFQEEIISDHVKMQWKLINLGEKAGSKVWIPVRDQSQIRSTYHYDKFAEKFSSGLDVPTKYVDNIDVVWKKEFRIDAAFETENTTAIYSGLLRFYDLKLVAPNSNYPLFIVAPTIKRNQLVDQLKRPTFKELGLAKTVRYLSYEAVNEIDKFFSSSNAGLNIDLLLGKSELINNN